ncbi:divalent metal cation transporter MntH [Lepeophtheirus salmonis]|uniref:Uncharacterized protein n=1 Tax=Lepeophtheirus salmonis TaxID=72036 RepID=A0A0K2TDB8_LEPSM|nr:uncharacterized protein LOC121122545 [Lepeophtheirus salmonis]XP_040573502.1 uncharacterized protein LOC121122545 [Lepeophtheirus salmonis]
MKIKTATQEIVSMLYWSMLAACTVGPGTVVTCARAGAEHGLNLIWALIFASLLAYTLQEGTARLTIVSGMSLGQCLRMKYRHGPKLYNTAVICWIVAVSVFFGNTLYECNNWAGGMSAIYSLPGMENTNFIRISCCIAYGVVVYALLFWDKTDYLSVGLGVIMVGMIILFFLVVINLGLDFKRFGSGFIPNIPDGSSNLVLSLVGTTSIGFNLFLGSVMAKGRSLGSAQRGIGFSTVCALEVSMLILIVGDGITDVDSKFSVANLAHLIAKTVGQVGLWVFGLGFIAAALSSMLTVPLGAAITADSVFSSIEGEDLDFRCGEDGKEVAISMLPQSSTAQSNNNGDPQENGGEDIEANPFDIGNQMAPMASQEDLPSIKQELKTFPRWIYMTLILIIVVIAVIVSSANLPTVDVIQVAQVFNGCLLPFFATCLLLCLNDPQFMSKQPQTWWNNIFLLVSVTITLFLAANVFVHNIMNFLITDEKIKMSIAGGVALIVMAIVTFTTSLSTELRKSFTLYRPIS